MYLYSRRRTASPSHGPEARARAIDLATQETATTGRSVATWVSWLSPDADTVVWTSWAEDLADLEAGVDKLALDYQFQSSLADAAPVFVGPAIDTLSRMVTPLPPADSVEADYVSVVRTTARNGRVREALAAGVQLAKQATEVSGTPTGFMVDVTGSFGGVRWVSGGTSADQVQRSLAALADDIGWLELLDSVGTVFGEGTRQDIYRRIG